MLSFCAKVQTISPLIEQYYHASNVTTSGKTNQSTGKLN